MRIRKVLLNAKYLYLILPITANSNFKVPGIGEGVYLDDEVVRICSIHFTEVFYYSLDSYFFVNLYEHFIFFLLGYALLASEQTICDYRY